MVESNILSISISFLDSIELNSGKNLNVVVYNIIES